MEQRQGEDIQDTLRSRRLALWLENKGDFPFWLQNKLPTVMQCNAVCLEPQPQKDQKMHEHVQVPNVNLSNTQDYDHRVEEITKLTRNQEKEIKEVMVNWKKKPKKKLHYTSACCEAILMVQENRKRIKGTLQRLHVALWLDCERGFPAWLQYKLQTVVGSIAACLGCNSKGT